MDERCSHRGFPGSDTRERGTPAERAESAAAHLRCELAEWPWVVSVAVERTDPPRVLVFVSLPVPAPGNLFAVLDGICVFRREAPCS